MGTLTQALSLCLSLRHQPKIFFATRGL